MASTWPPGRSSAYKVSRDSQSARAPLSMARSEGSSKPQRTWTQSMTHGVAKFFGVDDADEEKRKNKLKAKAQLIHKKSVLLSRPAGRSAQTGPPTAAEFAKKKQRDSEVIEMTAAPPTFAEYKRRSQYEADGADQTDSGGYESVSGLSHPHAHYSSPGVSSSIAGSAPYPLDLRAVPPTSSSDIDTSKTPPKRGNVEYSKSVTVQHYGVFRMALDGAYNSLVLPKYHSKSLPMQRSIIPSTIQRCQRSGNLDISFFDTPVPTSMPRRRAPVMPPAAARAMRPMSKKGKQASAQAAASDELGTDEPDSGLDSSVPFLEKPEEKLRKTKHGLQVPVRSASAAPPPPYGPYGVMAASAPRAVAPESYGAEDYVPADVTDGAVGDTMKYIGREFIEELVDNTNRHDVGIGLLGRCLGLKQKNAGELSKDVQARLLEMEEKTYRPYFTYWVTFVQIVCFIVSVAVYGFAHVGGAMTTVSGEVLTSSLSIEQVSYTEDSNFWLGPRQADLIHLGAKYSPCMRDDDNVRKEILKDREIESNTSCCVLNDGSGCVQTTEKDCSKSLASWMKWSSKSGPDNRTSGSVCGQDPRLCQKPASVGAYQWEDNIAKWPICEVNDNASSSSAYPHMTCPLAGRPCCIGVQGQCVITTREYCTFRRGYFHEEASLCSQVNCLSEICGMIPFFYPDKPDQFYRLWTSLFIHAGILQLLISVVFQLVLMRDLEKFIGWLKICIIYVVCGIGGSLASATFIPYHVEAGPSGAQFGILAGLFMEIISYRKLLQNSDTGSGTCWAIGWLSVITVVLFAIGLLPMIDNYAHLIGFGLGLPLSYALMPSVTFDAFDRRCRLIGVILCLLLTVGLLAMFILLFYVANIYTCPGCQYFNCVPLTETFCLSSQVRITRETEF